MATKVEPKTVVVFQQQVDQILAHQVFPGPKMQIWVGEHLHHLTAQDQWYHAIDKEKLFFVQIAPLLSIMLKEKDYV